MFGKRNILIVWVLGNQLVVRSGRASSTDKIIVPNSVVADLEILDQGALNTLIRDWATKHPNMGEEVVWIFGYDVYFEHQMQKGEEEHWGQIVERFLDLLPFEETESRVFGQGGARRVVAINKDYYRGLKEAFEAQGYLTLCEVVASQLAMVPLPKELSAQVMSYVERNLDKLVTQRVVVPGEETVEFEPVESGNKPKSSLPLLLAVFGILLLLLVLLYWKTYHS